MKSLEICGCGPSSMLIPPAMWRAGQLCKGSVLGCSLNPAGECQHWELFGKYQESKHPASFKNDGEEELLKPKRSHLRIFCGSGTGNGRVEDRDGLESAL